MEKNRTEQNTDAIINLKYVFPQDVKLFAHIP